MQSSDREFIEKYKQKQFQMRHPVPEVVVQKVAKEVAKEVAPLVAKEAAPEVAPEVAKEAAPEVAPEAAPEVAPEAAPEVAKEVAPVAVQEVAQVAVQKDINDALHLVNVLNADAEPLELIKSALQQITYALHLLEKETKKVHSVVEKSEPEVHSVVEKSEPEVHSVVEKSEPEVHSVVEKSEPEVHSVVEKSEPEVHSVVEKSEPEVHSVVEKSEPEVHSVDEKSGQEYPIQHPVPASAELVSIDHISDVDLDEKKEEEFKIFMPKKSKTKKVATPTVLPVQEKGKKDDFPSLGSIGSSFTPIKNPGFWGGEPRKSLEIAKAIAHIPSPIPISSPSPNLKKSITMVRGGQAYDDSDDDYFDSSKEFRIRKRSGDYDE